MLQNYPFYEYHLAAAQLILAMLGMGATLSFRDFWQVARAPQGMGLVLAVQLALVPWAAIGLARWLGLPQGIAVGMVLVAAMPSGSLANIFTYLGRGNVALSISATAVSTLGCLATTPLVLRIFARESLPADFAMPAGRIVLEIGFCLLLPLALGLAIGRWAPAIKQGFSRWCVRGSLLVLAAIVVGALGSGRLDLKAYGWIAPAALAFYGVLSQLLGVFLARLFRFNSADAFTIGIAVVFRNCNLAVLMKASLFPAAAGVADPIGDGVLFAALFYGGATLVLALLTVLARQGAVSASSGEESRPSDQGARS